jgi:superoxide reductase
MAKQLGIYKCEVCGNIVEVLHSGVGELVCCEKPMVLQKEKANDQGKEKHVPVIEDQGNGYFVKIGSVPHPMEEKHYIEWIELLADGKAYRQFLKPGDKPEAFFEVTGASVSAREYCNLHGLWLHKKG